MVNAYGTGMTIYGPEPSLVNHVSPCGALLSDGLALQRELKPGGKFPLGFSLAPRSAHHKIGVPLPAFGTAQGARPIDNSHTGAMLVRPG